MKITSFRMLNGANVHSHQPVMAMSLDLEDLMGKTSCGIPGFNAKLLELLPGLKEHYCAAGKPGGFVERLHKGTHFNHVIEHAALELLALAGFDKRHEKACGGNEKDDSAAVIETTTVETTRYLMTSAAEFVESIVKEKTFLLEEKITQAKEIAADTELGPSTKAIIEPATRRGIPWSRENEYSLIQLGYGKNLHFVQAAVSDKTSSIAAEMASDKDETKRRLAKFSIPVPEGEVVRSEEEAVKAFREIGSPVVVKPLNGRQGKGVSLNLKTEEEVVQAFRAAREYASRVLVEELFEGKNYRVLIVGGKMIAASERVPCSVIGDGRHTVGELIEIENQNPLRGEGHEKPLTKIKVNSILLASMLKEGWIPEDVPEKGEEVPLCAGMNLSTGGTARDATDEVHRSVKNMCERAARVVNLDICGVDLILKDISAPAPKKGGGVIELNAAPGLRMHSFPSEGKPRDVGGAIIDMLYPDGADGRIPIISITGTNGKTTVTRMIAHLISGSGLNVGMTTTDGISINGERIVKGDTTGPVSAKTILGDKLIDAAVLETARGGILRRGLGYDWSDVAVLTNISEDHIGQDGIESIDDLINIKALIAERVRPGGTLVINADDPHSLRVLKRAEVLKNPKKIIFFSLHKNNKYVKQHLAAGGTAYFPAGSQIFEAKGNRRAAIADIASIPATMNGIAEYQVANAMAAIAAARAYGLPAEAIKRLETFQNDADNPGRSNFYKVGKGYVMVDYGHNPGAFEAVCRMAARWRGKKVTGIIGVPGDRDDRIIKDAARIAARGFERIIIKEDEDTRGRGKGEVASLLCETVNREAPDRRCEIVLDEVKAFSKAVKEMKEDEVVVIFYDKLEPVLEVLEQHRAFAVSNFEEVAVEKFEIPLTIVPVGI